MADPHVELQKEEAEVGELPAWPIYSLPKGFETIADKT
jgi:hypothetical protein